MDDRSNYVAVGALQTGTRNVKLRKTKTTGKLLSRLTEMQAKSTSPMVSYSRDSVARTKLQSPLEAKNTFFSTKVNMFKSNQNLEFSNHSEKV